MTKVKFTSEENKILERVDNFEVEKQSSLIPRYAVYARDKNGWCLDCAFALTMWGANRYINRMTRKKINYDRQRRSQNGN